MILILAILTSATYLGIYYYQNFKKKDRKRPVEVVYIEKKYKIKLKKDELNRVLRNIGTYYSLVIGFAVLICFGMKNIVLAFLVAIIFYTIAFAIMIFMINRYGLKIKALRGAKKK